MDTSTRPTLFCNQWSRHNRRPHKVITEAEARKRHEQGKLYTAVLENESRPYCFLEFTAFRSVGVEFLDAAGRTYFDYSFQERLPNQFFISMSRRPEFPNDVDEPDRATVLFFDTEGQVTICRYIANPDGVGSTLVHREQRIADVSRNWEPYPEFGDYEGLATRDRGSPLLQYMPRVEIAFQDPDS